MEWKFIEIRQPTVSLFSTSVEPQSSFIRKALSIGVAANVSIHEPLVIHWIASDTVRIIFGLYRFRHRR